MGFILLPVNSLTLCGAAVPVWALFGWANVIAAVCIALAGVRHDRDSRHKTLFVLAGMISGLEAGAVIVPSVMTALAGGIGALILTQRFIGYRAIGARGAVMLVASVIALGRIGCFLSGCCFGAPTSLPWGIVYGPGSPAYWLHLMTHRIPLGAAHSLAVHPIQIYESIFLAMLVGAVAIGGKRVRSSPSVVAFSCGAYFLFRFSIEFIRDMTNVQWSLVSWGPLSAFQWFLLCTGIACLGVSVFSEMRANRARTDAEKPIGFPLWKQAALCAVIATASYAVAGRVLPLFDVLLGVLVPLCVLTMARRTAERFGVRLAPLAKLAGALGCMALCFPFAKAVFSNDADSAAQSKGQGARIHCRYDLDEESGKIVRVGRGESIAGEDDSASMASSAMRPEGAVSADSARSITDVNEYPRSGVAYFGALGAGAYDYEFGSCNGPSYMMNHRFTAGSFGIEKMIQYNRWRTYSYGVRGSLMADDWRRTMVSNDGAGSIQYPAEGHTDIAIGINPYAQFNFKWIGFGLGASVRGGPIRDIDSSFPNFPYSLSGNLRFGHPYLSAEFGLSDPAQLRPELVFMHAGLVSRMEHYTASIGLSNIGHVQALFMSLAWRLPNGFTLQPMLLVGDNNYAFNVGLRKEFWSTRNQNSRE